MSMTTVPSSQVRGKIASILKRLHRTSKPVFITRYGQTEAVLLSMERYNAMLDLLEDREDELDAPLGQRIREERQAYNAGDR
jgi:PHD/YefM family antitoxin component YafN of YafNO toxin-antitoxin module